MMRCILSTLVIVIHENTLVFFTLILMNRKSCKLNGGSSMNMVSESIVDRFAFKIESHPHPFKIDWVYKTLLPVKKRYLITFKI